MKILLSVTILLASAFASTAQIATPGNEAPPTVPDGLCNDLRNNPVELWAVCPTTPAPGENTIDSGIDLGTTSSIQQAPLLAPPSLLVPNDPLGARNRIANSPGGGRGNPAISPPPIR